MGAGHNHADSGHGTPGHNHAAGANARNLAIALAITSTFLVAELVGSFVFNSLALLSDAAHMFTDAAALAIALVAIKVGQRPADKQRTYGYRRFEILAASFNALLLFAVAGYVLWEGINRLIDPEPVASLGMLVVATFGLLANLVAMRVLVAGQDSSLNVKGAYLEVWADMLGSLGVIAAAAFIYLTGANWVDPIVAIAIGLWVLPRTWSLLQDTTHILLQGVPSGMNLDEIRQAVNDIAGVDSTHDLHVWSVAGDDASLTAHVILKADAAPFQTRVAIAQMLDDRFGIHHSTIQIEATACNDEEALHA